MDFIALRDHYRDLLSPESYLIRSLTSQKDDDHRSQLKDGILFSRWFIVTYQAAIAGVVIAVTLCRQYARWRRYQRIAKRRIRRTDERQDTRYKKHTTKDVAVTSSSSSASSSTQEDNVTPPSEAAKTMNEWTPLLDPESRNKSVARWAYFNPWKHTRATLLYQPQGLPIVHRVLPPHQTSLWILSLFGLNAFYLVYGVRWNGSFPTVLADRAGLLFIANLPWLYLVAAKNQPLKLLTGDSYENLNLLHRRLGEWMCFLAALHLAGMLLAWYESLRPLGISLLRFITVHYILWGCGAWVCYEMLYFLSLGTFREWWYEVFLGSHVLLQAGGLVTLFFHHPASTLYVAASLATFVLDRFVWRLGIKNTTIRVDLNVCEDNETVLVSADWPLRSKLDILNIWRKMLGWDVRYGWKPSEHIFITVPGMSSKHKLQFHPITIASAAPVGTHAWLNLIIRAKTGFSRDLLRYAQTHSSTLVRLDGPYGSIHALEMLHASDVAIVVAGGSGIAVAYPLIWSLLHDDTVIAKYDEAPAPTQRQQVCLIWVVQDSSHISWIGNERLEELKQLGLDVLIPPPSKTYGRPDVNGLLHDKFEDLCIDIAKVGVVVSGPDGLNRTVQNCCAEMARDGYDVEVAVEKFGW